MIEILITILSYRDYMLQINTAFVIVTTVLACCYMIELLEQVEKDRPVSKWYPIALAVVVTLALLFFCFGCNAQNDSCASAHPYPSVIPSCHSFPYQSQAQYCLEFTALQDTLYSDFSFIASCTQLDREYYLYDSACTLLDSNIDGKFVTPIGGKYVICCKLNCLSGLGVRGICITTELPLTFTSFEVSNDNPVRFDWVTASEVNVSYFEIQGGDDGENYVTLGRVTASGNSSSAKYYSYSHEDNSIYYRIAGVDYDGSRTYSGVRTVDRKVTENKYTVYSLQGNVLYRGETINYRGFAEGLYIVECGSRHWLDAIIRE